MSNKYISTPGFEPTAGDLEVGQLAINMPDAKVWTKTPTNKLINLSGLHYQGEYKAGTSYYKGDLVSHKGLLATPIVATSAEPSLEFTGDSGSLGEHSAVVDMTFGSNMVIHTTEYKPTEGGVVDNLRLFFRNENYYHVEIKHIRNDTIIRQFICHDLGHWDWDEWMEVNFDPVVVLPGDTMQVNVVVVADDSLDAVTNYKYRRLYGDQIPEEGQAIRVASNTHLLRVHKTDFEGNDRSTTLEGLTSNMVVEQGYSGVHNPIVSLTDMGDYVEIELFTHQDGIEDDLNDLGPNSYTELVIFDVNASALPPLNVHTNKFIANSEVTTLLRTGPTDSGTAGNDYYEMDFSYKALHTSSDWDYVYYIDLAQAEALSNLTGKHIKIGSGAGNHANCRCTSISIGYNAAGTDPSDNSSGPGACSSIAIGESAMGFTCGNCNSIAIGQHAGRYCMCNYNIAIGLCAGYGGNYSTSHEPCNDRQGLNCCCNVIIGACAGRMAVKCGAVVLGYGAGQGCCYHCCIDISTGCACHKCALVNTNAVLVGPYAGAYGAPCCSTSIGGCSTLYGACLRDEGNGCYCAAGCGSVALGYRAGCRGLGQQSVALGSDSLASACYAHNYALGVGYCAGYQGLGEGGIAIGHASSSHLNCTGCRGSNTISIGSFAARGGIGENAIVIGTHTRTDYSPVPESTLSIGTSSGYKVAQPGDVHITSKSPDVTQWYNNEAELATLFANTTSIDMQSTDSSRWDGNSSVYMYIDDRAVGPIELDWNGSDRYTNTTDAISVQVYLAGKLGTTVQVEIERYGESFFIPIVVGSLSTNYGFIKDSFGSLDTSTQVGAVLNYSESTKTWDISNVNGDATLTVNGQSVGGGGGGVDPTADIDWTGIHNFDKGLRSVGPSTNQVQIGECACANADRSVAVNYFAHADVDGVAIGNYAKACNGASTSLGSSAQAMGCGSIAIGKGALANEYEVWLGSTITGSAYTYMQQGAILNYTNSSKSWDLTNQTGDAVIYLNGKPFGVAVEITGEPV